MTEPFTQVLRRTIETLLIAAAGGIVFNLASFPAGWIAGSMVATGAVALAGRPLGIPQNLARAFYIVLGISIGAAVTPQTVIGMAHWPLLAPARARANITRVARSPRAFALLTARHLPCRAVTLSRLT